MALTGGGGGRALELDAVLLEVPAPVDKAAVVEGDEVAG